MWNLIVSVPDHCLSFYFVNESGTCKQDLQLTSATPRVNRTIAHGNASMHVIL